MSQLPAPVRATVGLVAVAVDGARTLPAKAVELPVLAVSSVLQLSLKVQQRYAELTMRGDDVIGRLRGVPDEPPGWATFDDTSGAAGSPNDANKEDQQSGSDTAPTESAATGEPGDSKTPRRAADRRLATDAPTVTKAVVPATNAVAASATKKVEGSPRNTVDRSPRKSDRKPRKTGPRKPVRPPRNTEPSAFDRVAEPVLEPGGVPLPASAILDDLLETPLETPTVAPPPDSVDFGPATDERQTELTAQPSEAREAELTAEPSEAREADMAATATDDRQAELTAQPSEAREADMAAESIEDRSSQTDATVDSTTTSTEAGQAQQTPLTAKPTNATVEHVPGLDGDAAATRP